MSPGRVGLAVNPVAGLGRGARHGARVAQLLRAAGVDVLDLSGPTGAAALARARAGLAQGVDALVVVGGDGMVHLGANALAGTGVPLGIVAVGSGNDVARDLGLPVHDVPAAVDVLTAGHTRDVDAVAVSRPGRPPLRWYLAVLSCGLDAAVNARANTLTWPRGNPRYVRALLGELRGFRPYGYRVTADGEVWEGAGTLVAVANTRSFGGGLRIAPTARPDDGLLDLVLAEDLRRGEILRVFPRLYRGTHVTHPRVHLRRARSVVVEALADHGPPPPAAMVDGEPLQALPVQCDLHPGAVRVLARRLGP